MAGHSKWANIKHRKAKQDALKGSLFTKFSKEIFVSAKIGGSDPENNFRLKTAISAAKSAGIPNDNIKRAIDKATGSGSSSVMESVQYEGYGPGGVAVIIETFTDNRHRTAGDIRSYFNKNKGNLGETNCVSWMFETQGIILISKSKADEETILDISLSAGAEDFVYEEEIESFKITTIPENLQQVTEALEKENISVDSANIEKIPQNTVEVTDPEIGKYLLRLLDSIENHDDVQNVYANFDMSDEVLENSSK